MSAQEPSYLPHITLLVVVVGWFVANAQANARETRKEARALLDDARKRTHQITDDALKYMCDGKTELAPVIKSALEALEGDLQWMPNFAFKGHPLFIALIDFQDAVTGGQFESAVPSNLAFDSPEVSAVLRSRNRLLYEYERQFRAYFR